MCGGGGGGGLIADSTMNELILLHILHKITGTGCHRLCSHEVLIHMRLFGACLLQFTHSTLLLLQLLRIRKTAHDTAACAVPLPQLLT